MEIHTTKPYRNIQNGANWCWVVAAKLVGENHLYPENTVLPDKSERSKLEKQIDSHDGFRRRYLGFSDGNYTIDQEQYNIVKNICTDTIDGAFLGDDSCKCRALRYVASGDADSNTVKIMNIGNSGSNLLEDHMQHIAFILQKKIAFIGNFLYIHSTSQLHSIMCCPVNEKEIYIYDPWDGYSAKFTVPQIFQTGFMTNRGAGKISWIQYITNIKK